MLVWSQRLTGRVQTLDQSNRKSSFLTVIHAKLTNDVSQCPMCLNVVCLCVITAVIVLTDRSSTDSVEGAPASSNSLSGSSMEDVNRMEVSLWPNLKHNRTVSQSGDYYTKTLE